MIRRSSSIWVSPGPPKTGAAPVAVPSGSSCAPNGCADKSDEPIQPEDSLPGFEHAHRKSPKIRAVRSITFKFSAFSKLRCWIGVKSASTTNSSIFRSATISRKRSVEAAAEIGIGTNLTDANNLTVTNIKIDCRRQSDRLGQPLFGIKRHRPPHCLRIDNGGFQRRNFGNILSQNLLFGCFETILTAALGIIVDTACL